MSTPSIGVLLGRRGEPRENKSHPVVAWLARYSPSQGWATFAILIVTLLIVANSINSAGWVESGGLTAILLWSAVFGLALAKVRLPWFILIPAGLLVGAIAVVWQASRTVEGDSIVEQLVETYGRLDIWWEAATTGGISTDLLPFLIMLLSLGWIAGFLSSWFIFRWSNVWVAVLLLGMAILTNLSFLPDTFASRFFIFVFLAMVLVVRVSIIQRHERWKRLNVRFTPGAGWLTLHATVWFSIAVLILAVALPMNAYTNTQAAQVWNIGRTPVATAEDFFARLFAALPSKKDQPGRLFGRWLPFIGKISFGGEAVGWASTDYPSYWLSQTYNQYTSKGWVATDAESIDIGPDILPPPQGDMLKRVQKTQVMQLGFSTDNFLTGGAYDWVSREGAVESLEPMKFYIHLTDDSLDDTMPADIRELADSLRTESIGMTPQGVQTLASQLIPEDALLIEVLEDDSGDAEWVVVQRKAPTTPDLVAWRFKESTEQNEAYRMTSLVSIATDDDLREASTEYDSFITDHYLQLPSSLPDRVRDLAERLTAGSDNPLDKALDVQEYLRGPEFTYSLDIEAPPIEADGVDWFLFDSKVGYSDYFGSSMAVMLRSVGVPARMAAGYAPGELNQDGQRVIRDSDSHGWVQVYFPGYGWIDFEPTPNWPTHDRSPRLPRLGTGSTDPIEDDPEGLLADMESDPFIEGLFEEADGGGGTASILTDEYGDYFMWALLVIASIFALWLLGYLAWNFGLGSLGPEARLYAKLTRLGWLGGIGRRSNQTPMEYAAHVGRLVPSAHDGASLIAWAYAAVRYGSADEDEERQVAVSEAWKAIRFSMVRRIFGRFGASAQAQTE